MKTPILPFVSVFFLLLCPSFLVAAEQVSDSSEAKQLLQEAMKQRTGVTRGRFEYEVIGTSPAGRGSTTWYRVWSEYTIIIDGEKIWCDSHLSYRRQLKQVSPTSGQAPLGELPDFPSLDESSMPPEEIGIRERFAYDGQHLYYSPDRNKGRLLNPKTTFSPRGEVPASRAYFHPGVLGLTPLLSSANTLDVVIPFHRSIGFSVLKEENFKGQPARLVSLTMREEGGNDVSFLYYITSQPPNLILKHRLVYNNAVYYDIDSEFWSEADRKPFPRRVTIRRYDWHGTPSALTEIIEKKADYDYQPPQELFSFAGLDLNVGAELLDARTANPVPLGRWEGQKGAGVVLVPLDKSGSVWLLLLGMILISLLGTATLLFVLYRRRVLLRKNM